MKDNSFDIDNPPHLIDDTFYDSGATVWYMKNDLPMGTIEKYHRLLNEINFKYERDKI